MFQIKRHSIPLNTIVFEGNDFLSFLGTYEALIEAKRADQLTTLAGTSSGAIVAMLLALGFTVKQVHEKLKELHFIEIPTDHGLIWDIEPIRGVVDAFDIDPAKRIGQRFRSWLEQCVAERLRFKTANLDLLAAKHASKPSEYKQLYLTAIDGKTGKLCQFSTAHDGAVMIVDSVMAAVSFSGNFVNDAVGNRVFSNTSHYSQFPAELTNTSQFTSTFDKIPAGENNTGILHVKSTWPAQFLQFTWFKQKDNEDPFNDQKQQCVCDQYGNLNLHVQKSTVNDTLLKFAQKSVVMMGRFPRMDHPFSFKAAKTAVFNWLHLHAKIETVALNKLIPDASALIQSDKISNLERYETLLARKSELENQLKQYGALIDEKKSEHSYSDSYIPHNSYELTNKIKNIKSDYEQLVPAYESFIKSHPDVVKQHQLRQEQQQAIVTASRQYFAESDTAKTILNLINDEYKSRSQSDVDQPLICSSMFDIHSSAISALDTKLGFMLGEFTLRYNQPQPRRNLPEDIKKMEKILSYVQFALTYLNENPIEKSTKKPFREYAIQSLQHLAQRIEKNRLAYVNYMMTEEYRARVFLESLERMIVSKDWEVGPQLWPRKLIRPSLEEKIVPAGVLLQYEKIDLAIKTGNYIQGQKDVLLLGAYHARRNNSFFSSRKETTREFYAMFEKPEDGVTPSIVGIAPSLYPAPATAS